MAYRQPLEYVGVRPARGSFWCFVDLLSWELEPRVLPRELMLTLGVVTEDLAWLLPLMEHQYVEVLLSERLMDAPLPEFMDPLTSQPRRPAELWLRGSYVWHQSTRYKDAGGAGCLALACPLWTHSSTSAL